MTLVAVNKRFVNPEPYTMPTAQTITSGASPKEQAVEARRRLREVAEQGQLAQIVEKPGLINNHDEVTNMVGDRGYKT